MVDQAPPVPALRGGFAVTSPWERVRGLAPEFAVSSIGLERSAGWICWIGTSGAHPQPLHAFTDASQAEVDRLAFNACRRIDKALGLPIRK